MSTDLVACQKCGEQLSPYVVTCPRCGYCRRNSRKRFRLRLFGDSGNAAGHVLENIYPRQGQQPPPPAQQPPQPPEAKAPAQAMPVTPPVPPVVTQPNVREPVQLPPVAHEPLGSQQPVSSPPEVQRPAVPPPANPQTQTATNPITHEDPIDSAALSDPPYEEADPADAAVSEVSPVESIGEVVTAAASPTASIDQADASIVPMAPEETDIREEPSTPTNKSEPDTAAVLPSEPAIKKVTAHVAAPFAETQIEPSEQIDERLEAAAPPVVESAIETEREIDEVGAQETSEGEPEAEMPAEEEYLDDDYEPAAKTKNARVVMVVVLMIVAAIAIKIVVSFF